MGKFTSGHYNVDGMTTRLIIEFEAEQGYRSVLSAIEAYKVRLNAATERSRRLLAAFEAKYGVGTDTFLNEWTAEDLEGGDLEYVEWAGEAKLLAGLEGELGELEQARYELPGLP